MRKHSFVLGKPFMALLAVMLVFGLAPVSCDNGTTGGKTKFEGRWLFTGAIGEGYTDYSFTFSRNNFVFRRTHLHYSSRNGVYTGTFTFTDNVITWFPAQGESWVTFSQTYQQYNNFQLSLGSPPPGVSPPWWTMTYDKQ